MFEEDLPVGVVAVMSPPVDLEQFDDVIDEVTIEALAAADPERPRCVSEVVTEAERGPINQALSAGLGRIDLDELTDDELIAVAVAADRCINHYTAVKLAAIAEFAGQTPKDDRSEAAFAWTDVAAALHVGEGTGRRLVNTARRLRSHLHGSFAAMRDGALSLRKAETLVEATTLLDVDQCAEVEARVLPRAPGRTPAQHTEATGRAVRAVDVEAWKARRKQKLDGAALIRTVHGDGVTDVLACNLSSLDAETLWTGADTWARRQKAAGDARTLDALRAAAPVSWASDFLNGRSGTGGNAPTRHGQPAVVNVLIDLPSAIAASSGADCGAEATVAGSGEPVPAEAVADLLEAGAKVRFALIDEAGRLVGLSTNVHDPTALIRCWVALRDVTLRTPSGSTTPVAGQDLDHLAEDGPTDPTNLHPPSRGWHCAKTFTHWSVVGNADGTVTWTSRRTGRSYVTSPYNHRAGPG